MLGFGHKDEDENQLPMVLQSLHNVEAFGLALKIWEANAHYVETDPETGKQYLHFGLMAPAKAVWIQHDPNRVDSVEVMLTWEDSARQPEVYAIAPYAPDEGDAAHAINLLTGILTGPATLPVNQTPPGKP